MPITASIPTLLETSLARRSEPPAKSSVDSDPPSWGEVWRHLSGEVQPDDVDKTLLDALLLISAGVQNVEALKVPVDVGQELLECYLGISET